ncbi:conserved hypothetical protein, partial [Ricinus communis]
PRRAGKQEHDARHAGEAHADAAAQERRHARVEGALLARRKRADHADRRDDHPDRDRERGNHRQHGDTPREGRRQRDQAQLRAPEPDVGEPPLADFAQREHRHQLESDTLKQRDEKPNQAEMRVGPQERNRIERDEIPEAVGGEQQADEHGQQQPAGGEGQRPRDGAAPAG